MKEAITQILCIGTLCLLLSKYVAGIEAGENQVISVPIPAPFTQVQDSMHPFNDGEYSGRVVRSSSNEITMIVRKKANREAYYYLGVAFIIFAVTRIWRCKTDERTKKLAEQDTALTNQAEQDAALKEQQKSE